MWCRSYIGAKLDGFFLAVGDTLALRRVPQSVVESKRMRNRLPPRPCLLNKHCIE